MSDIGDQGMRPPGVEQPDTEPEPGIEEPEAPVEEADVEEVPAGRAGADSGAADAVRIDPDDQAELPDTSTMNDEPGVGPGRSTS